MSLDAFQTIDDLATVRIALVPVGDIDDATFQRFVRILRSHSRVSWVDVTPPAASAYNMFPNLSWKKGFMNFKFIEEKAVSNEGDLIDMQLHRKVLAVFGIIHCKRYKDLSTPQSQFTEIIKAYPTAEARCFAVEPEDFHHDNIRHIIMIPAQSDEKLSFYFSTILQDFASLLLQKLNKMLSQVQQPEHTMSLLALLDQSLGGEDGMRSRRRKAARTRKYQGDICLLAGSPFDALSHYREGLEISRAASDFSWCGVHLQGCASAKLVLMQQAEQDMIKPSPEDHAEIIDKYVEAIGHHRKAKSFSMAVESSLQLARYFLSLGLKSKVCDVLSSIGEYSSSLAQSEMIEALSGIAALYKAMGYRRKYSYTLKELANCHKTSNHNAAHYFLMLAGVQSYLSEPKLLVSEQDTHFRNLAGKPVSHKGWAGLERDVLTELIALARLTPENDRALLYNAYFLRQQHLVSNQPAIQQRILNDLGSSSTASLPVRMSLDFGPILLSLTPKKLPALLQPYINAAQSQARKGPFLFSPTDARSKVNTKQKVYWVQGEVCEVNTVFYNPLMLPVNIEGISVVIKGVEYRATPSASFLPAQAISIITLSCRPISDGVATLEGCVLRFYNMILKLKPNPTQAPVPLKKVYPPVNDFDPEIIITKSLPTLAIQGNTLEQASTCLINGQMLEMNLVIENTSTVPIDLIDLGAEVSQQENDGKRQPEDKKITVPRLQAATVLSWEPLSISQADPLRPSGRVALKLCILAQMNCTGAALIVTYGNSQNPGYYRSVKATFRFSVQQGLLLSNFYITPFSVEAAGIGTGVDNPTAPPLDHNSHCLAVFVVSNLSGIHAQLEGKSNPPSCRQIDSALGSLKPSTSCRLAVPVRRFFVQEEEYSKDKQDKQFIVDGLTNEERLQKRKFEAYQRALNERVCIHWKSELGVHGKVLLDSIKMTEGFVRLLNPPPVSFSFLFAKDAFPMNQSESNQSHETVTWSGTPLTAYPTCKLQKFCVRITNTSQKPIQDYLLKLYPHEGSSPHKFYDPTFVDDEVAYLDHADQDTITAVCQQMCWMGSLTRSIPILAPGESQLFEFSTCFFSAGIFHFYVRCENTTDNRVYPCRSILSFAAQEEALL